MEHAPPCTSHPTHRNSSAADGATDPAISEKQKRLALLNSRRNRRKEPPAESRRRIPEDPTALIPGREVRVLIGGIARVTLFRMCKDGRFPAADVVLAGNRPLWRRSTIDAWIERARPRNSGAGPGGAPLPAATGFHEHSNAPTGGAVEASHF
jgi:predicted DNA-binding transcriptional regulator AlpA